MRDLLFWPSRRVIRLGYPLAGVSSSDRPLRNEHTPADPCGIAVAVRGPFAAVDFAVGSRVLGLAGIVSLFDALALLFARVCELVFGVRRTAEDVAVRETLCLAVC